MSVAVCIAGFGIVTASFRGDRMAQLVSVVAVIGLPILLVWLMDVWLMDTPVVRA